MSASVILPANLADTGPILTRHADRCTGSRPVSFDLVAAGDALLQHFGVVQCFPGLLLGDARAGGCLAFPWWSSLFVGVVRKPPLAAGSHQCGKARCQLFERAEIVDRQHRVRMAVQHGRTARKGSVAFEAQQRVEPQHAPRMALEPAAARSASASGSPVSRPSLITSTSVRRPTRRRACPWRSSPAMSPRRVPPAKSSMASLAAASMASVSAMAERRREVGQLRAEGEHVAPPAAPRWPHAGRPAAGARSAPSSPTRRPAPAAAAAGGGATAAAAAAVSPPVRAACVQHAGPVHARRARRVPGAQAARRQLGHRQRDVARQPLDQRGTRRRQAR